MPTDYKKNEVLSAALQNILSSLQGLHNVAKREIDKLSGQMVARIDADNSLSSRIDDINTNLGNAQSSFSQNITELNNAIEKEIDDRTKADNDVLSSAKEYVYTQLQKYYTKEEITSLSTVIQQTLKAYADQAEADAISTAATDATTKANKALEDAKAYADQAEADAISAAAEDATTKANKALADAKSYANLTSGYALNEAKTYTDIASGILNEANNALSTYVGELAIVKCVTLKDSINNEAEYALVDNAGKQFGTRINVTKDRFLSDVSYETSSRTLKFTFKLADGTDKVESVEIGDLVDTYTAGNGINVINNVITAVKDTTTESYLDITSSGIKVSGINKAINDAVLVETNARIAEDEKLAKDIAAINQQLGGSSSDGNSLTDRIKSIQDILPTSSIPEGKTLLVTDVSGKTTLNEIFNPGIKLQFNGKEVGTGITSLNFAGTTTITVTDGIAKVQIGENMNSSVWNGKDGKNGDGTVMNFPAGSNIIIPSVSGETGTTALFKIGDWTPGSTEAVGSTTSSISINSNGVIHMDEGENTWLITVYGATNNVLVEATVVDTVKYNNATSPTSAIVTASAVSYTSTCKAGITHSVTSGAIEPNYPAAVGGCAKVTFGIDLTKIDEIKNGGRYKVEIAGCGGTYVSPERFYIAGTTPSIGSITLQQKENTSYTEAIYSGVKYITAGNFVTSISNIKNAWNQAAVASSLTTTGITGLKNVNTGIAASSITTSNNYDSIGNYTDDSIDLATNYAGEKVTVNFNIKNAKGNANGTAASISGLNINTYTGSLWKKVTDSNWAEQGKNLEGKVVKIIQRGEATFVGIVRKNDTFGFVEVLNEWRTKKLLGVDIRGCL